MLKQPLPGAGRRRTGTIVLGIALSACSYVAWSARPAQVAQAGPQAAPVQEPVDQSRLPPPKYPADAAASGVEGRVMLKVLVGVDGDVRDVVVEQSSPEGVFDAATVEAVRHWRFQPRVENGRPIEGWLRVPVDFKATEPASATDGGQAPDRSADG